MPPEALAVGATAAVLLGVPHGALDHRVARPWLAGRWGRLWFLAFTLPYLGLAVLVFAGWLVAPALSLLMFLAVSVLHFGLEDAEGKGVTARLARGGAPVALPILLHPDRTARFFETLGGAEAAPGGMAWLVLFLGACLWVLIAALYALRLVRDREGRVLAEVGAIVAVFAALPPLAAFAFYFLAVHSPRHMAELARRHEGGWTGAIRASLPLSAMTFAMGIAIYLLLPGTAETRFLQTTFWGLAALTIPHMILHGMDRRRGGGPVS